MGSEARALVFDVYTMAKLPLLRNLEKGKVKASGYAYLLESEHAVKVGSTIDPYATFLKLRRDFAKYGDRDTRRLALSPLCGNYIWIAHWMRWAFDSFKHPGMDLFDAEFDLAVDMVESFQIRVAGVPQDAAASKQDEKIPLWVEDAAELALDIEELLGLRLSDTKKLIRFLCERAEQERTD